MGSSVFLIVILFIFGIVLIKYHQESRRKDQQIEKELRVQWKERREKVFSPYEIEQISYLSLKEKNENYIDDLTWKDLEMDRVYEKICYCSSTVGEEYFYHMLRNPMRRWEALKELENKIHCFETDENRVLLQKEFVKIGKVKKYSMIQYLDYLMKQQKRSNISHYAGILLLGASFGWMCIHLASGLLLFFAMVLYQITSYFKVKAELSAYLTSLRYLFKMIDTLGALLPLFPKEWQTEQEKLKAVFVTLKRIRRNSFLVLSYKSMSGQGWELLLDYVRMVLHPDLIMFNRILEEVKKSQQDIYFLYETLGKMDSCLSIAQYRNTLKYWVNPRENEKGLLEIIQGYHPLLEKPVANDLNLLKSLLLTGSNASGKSTFLKMLGVNLLLSQSINTAMARKFSFPYCRLLTCLSVKDSLVLAESYYVAEIKAIKRIFDALSLKEKIICMVDEILRGTNTMERIAASTEILREMRKKEILVLAATHDRELTRTLEDEFENYHLEEGVLERDLSFSFRILPGRADSTNAISLLSYMGYDPKIINRARRRLEKFQKEGEWV